MSLSFKIYHHIKPVQMATTDDCYLVIDSDDAMTESTHTTSNEASDSECDVDTIDMMDDDIANMKPLTNMAKPYDNDKLSQNDIFDQYANDALQVSMNQAQYETLDSIYRLFLEWFELAYPNDNPFTKHNLIKYMKTNNYNCDDKNVYGIKFQLDDPQDPNNKSNRDKLPDSNIYQAFQKRSNTIRIVSDYATNDSKLFNLQNVPATFYLFMYGNTPIKKLKSYGFRTKFLATQIRAMTRVFFDDGVATLQFTGQHDDFVDGLMYQIITNDKPRIKDKFNVKLNRLQKYEFNIHRTVREQNDDIIDGYIGYTTPSKQKRYIIQQIATHNDIPVLAYVHNPDYWSMTKAPSDAYLRGMYQMWIDRWILLKYHDIPDVTRCKIGFNVNLISREKYKTNYTIINIGTRYIN